MRTGDERIGLPFRSFILCSCKVTISGKCCYHTRDEEQFMLSSCISKESKRNMTGLECSEHPNSKKRPSFAQRSFFFQMEKMNVRVDIFLNNLGDNKFVKL